MACYIPLLTANAQYMRVTGGVLHLSTFVLHRLKCCRPDTMQLCGFCLHCYIKTTSRTFFIISYKYTIPINDPLFISLLLTFYFR